MWGNLKTLFFKFWFEFDVLTSYSIYTMKNINGLTQKRNKDNCEPNSFFVIFRVQQK